MLNPVAIFRSASSRSSSSSTRFLSNSATSINDEDYDRSSDFSEDSCNFSGSHHSTLDRLYVWERKLFEEVRAGERIRIAYEKKCAQLRKQDVKGEDPSFVHKTRNAVNDLHTRINVSIHTVEVVSGRIEILRDEELEPQILELIQGLARMWEMMAECHQMQKRTLDEAKILLAGTPSKHSAANKYSTMSPSEPRKLACSAANLETELRNWQACFESWIVSQRSYVQALKSWLSRCIHSHSTAPPILNTFIQWSTVLDAVNELPVLDGLDFFAAGVGALYEQQVKEDSTADNFENEIMRGEKMDEFAVRVLCAGMSVSVNSLTEFAVTSAEAYKNLVKQWENSRNSELTK